MIVEYWRKWLNRARRPRQPVKCRNAGSAGRRYGPSIESLEDRTLLSSTGLTGGGVPIHNMQPSLALNYAITLLGIYPSRDGTGGASAGIIGEIHLYAGDIFAGGGAVPANGQLLSISQNTAVFSLLGTTYGGDGRTTFALPDLRGRVPVMPGQGPGLTNRFLGEVFGTESVALGQDQMPAHRHAVGNSFTGLAGSGQPFDNDQPALGINYIITTIGGGTSALGEVRMFAGNFAPTGTAFADGRLLPISDYEPLFQLLGTIYGGDGQTTFALPDLRGRTPLHIGQGVGLSNRLLSERLGAEFVTLTQGQLPSHNHTVPGGGGTDNTGGGQPFFNMQPSMAMNYMIALQGIYPSRDNFGFPYDGTPLFAEVRLYAYDPGGPAWWAPANGQLLFINQNQALFSLLGTTYGGDGRTTFALPDLRGRAAMHTGQGPGLSNRTLGERLGTEIVTLTTAQLPAHSHTNPNDAPTLTATALNPTFTEAAGSAIQALAVSVFSNTSISTVEPGQTIKGLTFTVSGLLNGANEVIVVEGKQVGLGANSSGTTISSNIPYSVTNSGTYATVVFTPAGATTVTIQTLVNSLKYQNTNLDNPIAGKRVITLKKLRDSGGGADTMTLSVQSLVTVVGRNDAPTLTATALNPTFTEAPGAAVQALAVNVFSNASVSTVEPGQTIKGLTVTVSGLLNGVNEMIVIEDKRITLGANSSGVTPTSKMPYSVTNFNTYAYVVFTPVGASTATMQSLVNGIRYQNANLDNPAVGNRVFTLKQVKDSGGTASGGVDTKALNVGSVVKVFGRNDAPTLTATALNPTFTEAPGAAVQALAVNVFGNASVSTVEPGQTIKGLTVTVSGLLNGANEVAVIEGKQITLGTNGSGVTTTSSIPYTVTNFNTYAYVVFTPAGASTATVQNLVNGIRYQNTNLDNPAPGNRVFGLKQVKDSGGTAAGGIDTKSLAIVSVVKVFGRNDPPTLTAAALNPTFTKGVAAVSVFSGASVSTVEPGQTIKGLTFTVSGLLNGASETIQIDGSSIALAAGSTGSTATNSIAYNVTIANGVATVVLSTTGVTTATMQTLVNGIKYRNTNLVNPSPGQRVFTLKQLKDSGKTTLTDPDTTTLSVASAVTVVG